MAFRYKITIEYHGGQYSGWQKQRNALSVQEVIETAAQKFCGYKTLVQCAGRTDAGVHAIAQVAHLDLETEQEPFRVMQGINFHLFDGQSQYGLHYQNRVAITACEPMPEEWHARFSATRRYYFYRIINRRARLGLDVGRGWCVIDDLDEQKMQQGANLLVGTHDFTSFRDIQCQAKSPIKTLDELKVVRHNDEIHINTNAQSFLHHQVRIIVGTLAMVGRGKWSLDQLQAALDAKDRRAGGATASADGLYLTQVDY